MMSEQQCVLDIPETFFVTSSLPSFFIPLNETAPGKHTPLVSIPYSHTLVILS